MSAPVPQWRIDLSSAPRVIVLGTAVHGERLLTEQYHSHFWVLLLFHYHGEVTVDGHRLAVEPGMAGVFPPGATLTIRYQGRSYHRYAHLALPAGRLGKDQPIAALHALGSESTGFDAGYEAAIRAHAASPERASMLLWDLLWRLAERTGQALPAAEADHRHPALRHVEEQIEMHLGQSLRVATLAEDAGISARQLGNLFHAAHGVSPVAYIRRRRMERARALLTRTSTPMARIAADIGIPDAQAFNKTVRRELGACPSDIRRSGASNLARPTHRPGSP